MPSVIDELVTILGFEVDGRAAATIHKFNSSIDAITRYAGWASAALLTASSAVAYFAERSADAAADIDKFSQLTGIATSTVQEWGFAAEQAGGSAASMQADLDRLTRTMSSPIPGEFNSALFMLGVSTVKVTGELKSADEVLLDISDKMQGMSAQRQLQWGSKIGLSDDTIRVVQMTREEIELLRQQAKDIPTVVDEESLKNAREFVTQLSLIRRVFTYIGQTVSSSAGPAVKEIVSDMIQWIKQNREFIQMSLQNLVEGIIDGFKRFAQALDKLKNTMYDFMPGLEDFVDTMNDSGIVSGVVFSALMALAVVLAVLGAKFLVVTLLMTAASLVVEDFLTYLEGGESVFGNFVEWLDGLGQAFATEFPAITEVLNLFLGLLKDIGAFVGTSLLNTFAGLGNIISNVFKGIVHDLSVVFGWIDTGLQKLGFGADRAEETQAGKRFKIQRAVHSPPGQTGAQSGGNTINITNNISGENAPAIASETTRKMNFSLQQTYPGGLAPVSN